MNIKIGVRLLLASILVMIGTMSGYNEAFMLMAGLVLTVPLQWRLPRLNRLAVGLSDDEKEKQEELLKALNKEMQKIVDKAMTGVSQEAIDKMIEKWNKKAKTLTQESTDELKAAFDKYYKEHAEKIEAQMTAASEKVNVMAGELKAYKEQAGGISGATKQGDKPYNLRVALAEGFAEKLKEIPGMLQEVNDDYGKRMSLAKYMRNGGQAEFEIKAPINMFETGAPGIFGSDSVATQYALAEIVGPRVSIPLAVYPHVTQLFSVKNIKRPFMALMVVVNYEDGAVVKAEGSAANKSSLQMVAVTFKAIVISTYFVLSEETLEDLDEILDEIGAIGPDKIMSKVDLDVLSTGGDDITTIKGIRTTGPTGKSTFFNPVPVQDVPNAKSIDVYMAMKLQAFNAGYKPNLLIISPDEEFAMGADKNTLGDSRQDRRVAYNNQGVPSFIGGLAIAVNNGIPKDQAIVLDNSLAWLGIRRTLNVKIGYSGTDFIDGKRTIVIDIRLAFGVRDKAGIIWSNAVFNNAAQISLT